MQLADAMTRGKGSPKIAKKKSCGKSQPGSNGPPAVGKKRKKKGECVKAADVPSVTLLRSGVASGECYSSSSSLDNKPVSKQGRFDCSSSERMSTDHTSSSAMMDTTYHHMPHSSPPHPLTVHSSHHHTPIVHSPHHHTSVGNTIQMLCEAGGSSHDTTSTTDRSHDSDAMSHDTVHQSPHPRVTDSDRWEGVCSDEEQERRRLEVYKENRRRRYESALEEKLSLLPKTHYYSTDPH